jgi:hypothetical protein
MKRRKASSDLGEPDESRLSPKMLARLKRRIDDHDDPTRYVIVSAFSQRFCLYYCLESGCYVMNEIPDSALFKRKAEAQAVAKVLDRGRRRKVRKSLQVVAVRKTKRRIQFVEQVASPLNKHERWTPKLRRRRN